MDIPCMAVRLQGLEDPFKLIRMIANTRLMVCWFRPADRRAPMLGQLAFAARLYGGNSKLGQRADQL